ncbi:hypothetical protein ABZP36_029766 [Zizania latifolia]
MTSTTSTNNNPASTITAAAAASSRHQQQLSIGASRTPHSSGGGAGSPRGTGSGGGGGTNQACAACKYQRRKCNPDCPMAPYFPADQQRRFLNAHRLFGVSNILKTLRLLKPELCDDAMRTLIYQAEMRAHDPVGGCYHVILELERQLEFDTAELSTVLHQLAFYRQAATAAASAGGVIAATLPASIIDDPCVDLDVTSSNQPLLISADQEVVDTLYTNQEVETTTIILHTDGQRNHDQSPHVQQNGQHRLFDYFYYDSTAGDDASSKQTLDIKVDGIHHLDFDTNCDDVDHKVELTPGPMPAVGMDEPCYIDLHRQYETKAAPPLVDVLDMRQEQLQVVDVNADIDIKEMVDMNTDINVVKAVVDVNADIGIKEELREEEDGRIAAGEEAHMAESSHCKLGLGFSSF